MSDGGGSGAGGAAGGAGGGSGKPNSNDGGGGSGDPKPELKTYSSEFVEGLMDEKKSETKKRQELETWKNERELKDKEADEKRLKDQGKYKEALVKKEKETEDLKGQLSAKDKQILDSRKLSAFLQTIDGDLKRNYWGLIDLEKVEVDDKGKPTDDSLKKAVGDFQTEYPEVLVKKGGPSLPIGGGKPPGAGTLTHAEWLKLPHKEMAKRMKDVEGFVGTPTA